MLNKKPVIILLFFFLIIAFSIWFYDSITIKSRGINNPKPLSPISSPVKNEKIPGQPTINTIFSNNHKWVEALPADRIRIITATGDIIPARSVNYEVSQKNNFLWPYEKVVPILKKYKSDQTLINLESPLIPDCPITNTGMIFCGNQKNIEGLKYLGTNIANLANNHLGNFGTDGINTTEKLLTDNGIDYVGVGNVLVKDIRGIKFSFLGFNDIEGGVAPITDADKDEIIKEIKQAKTKADVVIVTFHYGVEYQPQPSQRQIELSHLAIDNGADLIIGNHPHWIEPVEIYKGKYITYAHGNFVFDQMWSEETKEGVIGRYVFYDKKLIDIEFLPIHIDNYGQASFGDENYNQKILSRMKNESLKLKTNLQ